MTLTKLREIAMAAEGATYSSEDFDDTLHIDRADSYWVYDMHKRDRDHIATFSPAMVLKLLEVVDCALELQEIFAPDYNGDYVDSFTMQPMNRALAALKGTE